MILTYFGMQIFLVLIDTWWNVNLSRPPIMILVVPSFNRYMVECEFNPANPRILPFCVLIDTWWNVNRQKTVCVCCVI